MSLSYEKRLLCHKKVTQGAFFLQISEKTLDK